MSCGSNQATSGETSKLMSELITFIANSDPVVQKTAGSEIVPQIDISDLKFVGQYDEILKEKMPAFDFFNPPFDPVEFAHALVKKMLDSRGIGLAANQVGIRSHCFAMAGEPNTVAYNPTIIGTGEEEDYFNEGCLSYPNLFVRIKRKKSIRVRFTQPNGEIVTKTYAGLTARVFQHEMDHLDGQVFYQRANLLDKTKAFKNRDVLNRRLKRI